MEQLRRVASPGVIIAALLFGSLLLLAAVAWFFLLSPPQFPLGEAPAAGLTIFPAPSSTPPDPSSTPVPTSTQTPTFEPLLPGQLGVGSYVQIVGTEGDGLNIRNSPGLSSEVDFLGYDTEVFEVREGPREADGLVWWYLVTPVDQERAGWAAANFLSVVANP